MTSNFLHSFPPANESQIYKIQRNFDLEFPRDYVRFLMTVNGGTPANPVFQCLKAEGGVENKLLLYLLGVTDEPSIMSAVSHNESFYGNDPNMKGFWIVGATNDGHLILDCKKNEFGLCDLNATYGIPDDGFPELLLKSFDQLLTSLSPDPTGKWVPVKWDSF